MDCAKCGHHNPVGTKFCGGCGAKLALVCGACGTSNPSGNKFCGECGNLLGLTSPTQSPITAKFASPQAYTPQHLAERILSSKRALEGERKQVTVLFADLKGSMELLADRDPEEARALLDPVLERMMGSVHHYEGTVNQVMGDGIMALFGAPLAHEDHAVRACYAALRMQDTVKRYAEEVRRAHGVAIHIRIGLNSGEVVVRSIGSDLHMDYTAVGQTTHLAARMEQMAMPGSILMAPETLRLAEGFVQVNPLGAMKVKGLSESVQAYELSGTASARSRFQVAAGRGLTRFVGRDAELLQLHQALERAGKGHGQVVALMGEPGVGKSRLVWEFTRSHRTAGWLVLESGSVSYGKATPYLPVIDLVKAYCKIEDRDDQRAVRERVTGKLFTLDRALEPLLPAFFALLDVPVEDNRWQGLDPRQRRERTLEAVKRLLIRESQVQPLLLVFEDLHWIDTETQALLDGLVESLPTTRVLLLVNYRPEYQHGWGNKTYYTQLRLDPLPPESAEEFLNALVGVNETLASLKALLIERTDGNPFFLEESVRTLIETKALVGERGAYHLDRPLSAVLVPPTVQAMLAARIDRLPPNDKHLLQTASVIGKDVPFIILQAIAEMSEGALQEGLARLQAAEFIYETSIFPDRGYTFKHALTHEVTYNSLLQERRREIHRRAGKALERLFAERLEEFSPLLARHFFECGDLRTALTYAVQAAEKANVSLRTRRHCVTTNAPAPVPKG
jgi:class 3 adenylate cyclase